MTWPSGLGAEVELHAGLEAPVERHLVDGDGALALVHRRMEMIGRVEMRAVVRREIDVLDRPALAVGQVFLLQAGEEAGDLAGRVVVLVILDLRAERHGIGNDVVLEIDRQVDETALHGLPPRRNGLSVDGAPVNSRGDRLDRLRQELADALLAEVVEMQAVVGDELRVGHAVVVPGAHDLEAAEQAGALLLGDLGHDARIFLLVGQRHDGGHILQVHQHEVGAQRLAERRCRRAGSARTCRAACGGSRSWCRPARPRDGARSGCTSAFMRAAISSASWPPMPLLKTWTSMPGSALSRPHLELGRIGEVRDWRCRSPGSTTSPWRRCAAGARRPRRCGRSRAGCQGRAARGWRGTPSSLRQTRRPARRQPPASARHGSWQACLAHAASARAGPSEPGRHIGGRAHDDDAGDAHDDLRHD